MNNIQSFLSKVLPKILPSVITYLANKFIKNNNTVSSAKNSQTPPILPQSSPLLKTEEQNTGDTSRHISNRGIELIKMFEGLKLKVYKCPKGKLSIGYGHTKTVKPDMIITEEEANKLLLEDIKNVESHINKVIIVPLTQNQLDALCSFVYNVGVGNFKRSTLLKKLNKGLYEEAAKELLKWDKVNNKPLKGLTKRRKIEYEIFLSKSND